MTFLVKYKGGCIERVILFTHLVYFSKRWLKCYNFREIQGQESIFCQQNITKSDQVFIIICFLDARGDWTLSRECERVLIILYSIYAMSAWEFFGAYFVSFNNASCSSVWRLRSVPAYFNRVLNSREEGLFPVVDKSNFFKFFSYKINQFVDLVWDKHLWKCAFMKFSYFNGSI